MTRTANNLTWKVYRDGDRYIIGAAEWQSGAFSQTMGLAEVYIDENPRRVVPQMIRRAQVTPTDRCEELKRVYWTDRRFEQACDDGRFGPEWE